MVVINVRGVKANDPSVAYCGRQWAGWVASPLGNPCVRGRPCPVCAKRHGQASDTIPCYRRWLLQKVLQEDPIVTAAMKSLSEDSVLGCWCKPNPCHCDAIVEIWRGFFSGR